MCPEPNATVQDGLLGEFDVGAAVEQRRELRGFTFGVLEKFEGCKHHNRWVSHSHRNGVFPLFSQTFPLCAALPSPTSLDLLHSSLGYSRSIFFPIYHQDFQILSPGITFIHLYIYTLSLLIY